MSLFVIHGSYSTLDYTPFSDIDTQLFLTDRVFQSPEVIDSVAAFITAKSPLLRYFDRLQHHGYFISLDLDRGAYPESFLPLDTLRKSTSIFGAQEFIVRPRIMNYADQFAAWHMGYFFRASILQDTKPGNTFDQKRFLSRFSMLPLLELELTQNIYPYKGDVFSNWEDFFNEEKPEVFQAVTRARDAWDPHHMIRFDDRFYQDVFQYAEDLLCKLRQTHHE